MICNRRETGSAGFLTSLRVKLLRKRQAPPLPRALIGLPLPEGDEKLGAFFDSIISEKNLIVKFFRKKRNSKTGEKNGTS
jgi:hypothetical protein